MIAKAGRAGRVLLQFVQRSSLVQAGLAIGVAGAGRIALNSLLSLGFGPERFAGYAALISTVMLWAGLASAGPSAAITLTVSRNRTSGAVSRRLLWFLAGLVGVAILAALVLGGWGIRDLRTEEQAVWVVGVVLFVLYQAARALGYAIRLPRAVTVGEIAGACLPLAAVAVLLLAIPSGPVSFLVAAFVLGPLSFLIVFGLMALPRTTFDDAAVTPDERRLALRATVIFLFGAGSSMAMQYLPIVLAGRLQATTIVAVMFGALQATTPLLLFSRVYGTIMMPELAASEGESQTRYHVELLTRLRLPTFAVAMGVAPWVVLSLGVRPDPASISVAALVSLVTLMSVWSTPAVTLQSSREQEMIPAAASVSGFVVASCVWVAAVKLENPLLFPVGLALGGLVRSLVPMWLFTRSQGSGPKAGWQFTGVILLAGSLAVAARTSPIAALATGAALVIGGLVVIAMSYREIRRLRADPAR